MDYESATAELLAPVRQDDSELGELLANRPDEAFVAIRGLAYERAPELVASDQTMTPGRIEQALVAWRSVLSSECHLVYKSLTGAGERIVSQEERDKANKHPDLLPLRAALSGVRQAESEQRQLARRKHAS